MIVNPLGKGEVESSILSCSTINQQVSTHPAQPDYAETCVNDSGTVAENWQSLFGFIDKRDREYRYSRDDLEVTYFYRYFSRNHLLIYCGITSQPFARHVAHGKSVWANFPTHMCIERLPYRKYAAAVEYEAIKAEKPDFNAKSPYAGPPFPPSQRWYERQMQGRKLEGEHRTWAFIGEDWRQTNVIDAPDWWTLPE